jgi:predicted ABC-type ATPase
MAAIGGAGAGADTPPNMALVKSLSELTPAVVDHLYGIDVAMPQAKPTFVLLVGAPGVGKSSGHAFAIKLKLLPAYSAGGYATINLDTLLESLVPFRAGSALAYVLKEKYKPEDTTIPAPVSFSSLHMYGSKKENVGAFGWYDDTTETKGRGAAKVTSIIKKARSKISNIGANTINANIIRNKFVELKDKESEAGKSIIDINTDAIQRAIDKGISIIYETTLSKNADGNVTKVDDIMGRIAGKDYRVVILHMTAEPEDIAKRIYARQEYSMPYEEHPFYRYVPADPKAVITMAKNTADAVDAIGKKYKDLIEITPLIIEKDDSRLPASRNVNTVALMTRLKEVYAPSTNSNINALTSRLEKVSLTPAMGGAGGPSSYGGARRSRRRRHRYRHRYRSTNKKR